MDSNLEIDGFVEARQELERLMLSNPAMEKKVQGLIRKVLMEARRKIGAAAESKMQADPRQAYKAVKTAVYRQILGGSVSILRKKKAGTQFSAYEPPRRLRPGQVGGNRAPRSRRTEDLIHYAGPDRGFILRFLNQGTSGRVIANFKIDSSRDSVHRGARGGNLKKYGKTINTGYRGSIRARNFFGQSSAQAMRDAADHLTQLIDQLIKSELK